MAEKKKSPKKKNVTGGFLEEIKDKKSIEKDDDLASENVLSPNINLYEKIGGYYLLANLPGVKNESLDVKIEDDVLTIKGYVERKEGTLGSCVLHEIEKGVYYRKFRLMQEIDFEHITANIENGVLSIDFPTTRK